MEARAEATRGKPVPGPLLLAVAVLLSALLVADVVAAYRGAAPVALVPRAMAGLSTFQPAPPPPDGWAVDFSDYPASAAVLAFCRQLADRYPHLVRLIHLGESYLGSPILALEIGNRLSGDPAARPALQMDGQHHAREPIGQQAVLYTVWHLLSNYGADPLATHLLDTRTLYAVPCVNPDGNDFFRESYYAQRKNLRPLDDDGDGRVDEDWPVGANAWTVYQVYELRLRSGWVAAHGDDPFAPGWRYAARSRYIGYYDAVAGEFLNHPDADGDGKILEDQPGGVDLNRNYPAGWDRCDPNPRSNVYRGAAPFSEPETRAFRTLIEAHPNIRLAVSYHSGDDRLAIAGTDSGSCADAELIELVGIKASQLTEAWGYRGTPHQHGSLVAPGETRAWLYEQGILAWLTEAYLDEGPFGYRWIDREEGTIWAYEHIGRRFNPEPDGILAVCRRWLGLNLYLLAAVPCPRPGDPILDGATLRMPVHNDGFVPVDVGYEVAVAGRAVKNGTLAAVGAAHGSEGWLLKLDLSAADREALAGGAELSLTLRAGGASREYRRDALVSRWSWTFDAGQGEFGLVEGSATGSPPGALHDLGAAFGQGGWHGDPAVWDQERYHMGRIPRPVELTAP